MQNIGRNNINFVLTDAVIASGPQEQVDAVVYDQFEAGQYGLDVLALVVLLLKIEHDVRLAQHARGVQVADGDVHHGHDFGQGDDEPVVGGQYDGHADHQRLRAATRRRRRRRRGRVAVDGDGRRHCCSCRPGVPRQREQYRREQRRDEQRTRRRRPGVVGPRHGRRETAAVGRRRGRRPSAGTRSRTTTRTR